MTKNTNRRNNKRRIPIQDFSRKEETERVWGECFGPESIESNVRIHIKTQDQKIASQYQQTSLGQSQLQSRQESETYTINLKTNYLMPISLSTRTVTSTTANYV